MAAISEDLPALGKPIKPISATVFNSRTTSRLTPGSPSSAKPGALRRVDANEALPNPPRPPSAITYRVPAPTKSANTVPSESETTVPSGTGNSKSPPNAPFLWSPCPGLPLPDERCGLRW